MIRADFGVHFKRDGRPRVAKFSHYEDAKRFARAIGDAVVATRWRRLKPLAEFKAGAAVFEEPFTPGKIRRAAVRKLEAIRVKTHERVLMRGLKLGATCRRVNRKWYIDSIECTGLVNQLMKFGHLDMDGPNRAFLKKDDRP